MAASASGDEGATSAGPAECCCCCCMPGARWSVGRRVDSEAREGEGGVSRPPLAHPVGQSSRIQDVCRCASVRLGALCGVYAERAGLSADGKLHEGGPTGAGRRLRLKGGTDSWRRTGRSLSLGVAVLRASERLGRVWRRGSTSREELLGGEEEGVGTRGRLWSRGRPRRAASRTVDPPRPTVTIALPLSALATNRLSAVLLRSREMSPKQPALTCELSEWLPSSLGELPAHHRLLNAFAQPPATGCSRPSPRPGSRRARTSSFRSPTSRRPGRPSGMASATTRPRAFSRTG